jgi:predicted nucleic-acid-binding Zn-ribbon protein
MAIQDRLPRTCQICGGSELFSRTVADWYGPDVLKGLGSLMPLRSPKFSVLICAGCGHTDFFADEAVLEKLRSGNQKGWQKR